MLIGLIIFLILNAKVMPRKISVNHAQTRFIVDGEVIDGDAQDNYTGKGKKYGSLQVTTPHYGSDPLVAGGFDLVLKAASPRRVKSRQRRVYVTAFSPSNVTSLQSLSIGSHTLTKLDEGDDIAWSYDGQPTTSTNVTCSFDIGHNVACVFVGETIEGTSFTLSVNLRFD